jgi:hypothetical protein
MGLDLTSAGRVAEYCSDHTASGAQYSRFSREGLERSSACWPSPLEYDFSNRQLLQMSLWDYCHSQVQNFSLQSWKFGCGLFFALQAFSAQHSPRYEAQLESLRPRLEDDWYLQILRY